MKLYQCLLVKNRWYGGSGRISPKGIVVHSTGANNPELRRYVNPVRGQKDGMGCLVPKQEEWSYYKALQMIGTNQYGNHWNDPEQPYGVHAWIGKMADGEVAAVQTLPWDRFLYGCGSGRNGSYNATHIQFEICEDTMDRAYTDKAYKAAVELCSYLCKLFDLPVSSITSHSEAHAAGYASNHTDPVHWWGPFGHTMDQFRTDVKKALGAAETLSPEEITVQHAIQDIGINSPDYWLAVLTGRKTVSPANLKAILDKYHNKVSNLDTQ